MSGSRLPSGGDIDRTRPLRFTFDGRTLSGFAGDTLASALLANGVSIVGRSFKYHRPRGLLGAGVEEPNAIVQTGEGGFADPNLRATEVELYDGLIARAVNCWPSARFDVGAVLRPFERFLPAGFYYKTFMWPDWHWFEGRIRAAAGLGRISGKPDASRYETRYAHCDVLVVGGGHAGLAAAVEAATSGARVILCEQDSRFGGRLRWEGRQINGLSANAWTENAVATLRQLPETEILTRTTAVGYFDHNAVTLLERVTDHLGPNAPAQLPRQRLWQVRASRVILATGAIERPLVFPGNDRPGIMLASAVREYLGTYAVRAGGCALIFTNNDDAYRTAHALLDSQGKVAAVIDARRDPSREVVDAIRARGVPLLTGAVVVATHGRPRFAGATVRDDVGRQVTIEGDLLAMSGGVNPTVHLFSQSGGKLEWDAERAHFKPGRAAQATQVVGSAAGAGVSVAPLWRVPARGKAFVDFQNDVTADDIELAARENFVSVEHLKRYTTLGMAPDQGKTSNVNALALMAELTGCAPAQAGTTRYRFPFTPVSFGALRGSSHGELFRPLRRMPAHDWHVAHGAVLEEFGSWLRPAHYLRSGERVSDAERREALAVRTAAGLFDGSPLGKIEVKGPDAAEFLDRVYANTMSTLKVGRLRYGLMLNELGAVIDDGVTARIADDHFLVGTTGGGAERITAWLDEWLQCEWPDLQVVLAPLTTTLAVLTLSGPNSRAVLQAAGVDFPVSAAEFPHMSFRTGAVAGVPARVSRVSFTGEVSYEINVAVSQATLVWERLMDAGAAHGLSPVGIDAWMLLRTEKGYLHVGADTDGTTAPEDIGWGHVLRRDCDFIGRRSLTRPENLRTDRLQFVGLEPMDGGELPIGAHLRGENAAHASEGYITSAGFSPILNRWVALAMLRAGRTRHGETVSVVTPAGTKRARVAAPGAYDPQGARLRE